MLHCIHICFNSTDKSEGHLILLSHCSLRSLYTIYNCSNIVLTTLNAINNIITTFTIKIVANRRTYFNGLYAYNTDTISSLSRNIFKLNFHKTQIKIKC